MADFLLREGVDSVKYLDGVVSTAADLFGYGGDCSNSEELSKQVLILPNHYGLREKDIKRVVDAVNGGWAELARGEFSTRASATTHPQPGFIAISK